MRKKILFITGTRADFGKMKPLLRRVEESEEFESYIFATGMHMLTRYGRTVTEIEKEGFSNIFTYINQDAANNSRMDLTLATTIEGLGHYIQEFKPDLIVIHGDRIEALAGATVGALENILVAHIEGGELSGTVDELIRHAVSKLSHIHFTANDEARQRLIQLGELEESIFVIGSPDIDVMLSDNLPTMEAVRGRYEFPFEDDYYLFAYHPVTTELDTLSDDIEQCVEAMKESGFNYVVIYPNNDRGSEKIFEAFKTLEDNPKFRFYPSLRFEYFLTLLKNTRAIVGNSSAGIREAGVYGVSSINIGNRQMNRTTATSVVHVPNEKEAVLNALRNVPATVVPSFEYGQGNSADLFFKSLKSEKLWETSAQKQFRDLPGMKKHP